MTPRHYLLILIACVSCSFVFAQKKTIPVKTLNFDEKLYNALEWRNIGPFRGGRSAAVTGVPGKPNLYYMGATGGENGRDCTQRIAAPKV